MSKYKDKINTITNHALSKLDTYAEYLECAEKYQDDEDLHQLYIDLAMQEKNHFLQLHNRVGHFFKDMYGGSEDK